MRTQAIWRRASASAVAPIGLIVAVAIIAIVVAVLTSAHRADEVAMEIDGPLFAPTSLYR